MSPVIHLISDLHLCETQPHITALLKHYLTHIAPASEELFILGDLFEMWVGDDHLCEFNQQIIELLAEYSCNHGKLFVAHGNRDFLLGKDFAKAIGATLIHEPFNMAWDNKHICLMHGDALCTDDTAYQEFKSMVRNPQWQQNFLAQPLANRLAYAASVREQSKNQQQEKSAEIMDVNQQAVQACFIENQCEWLIHGHTHRENRHQVETPSTHKAERIVLSDWGNQGHYLALNCGQLSSHYFDI